MGLLIQRVTLTDDVIQSLTGVICSLISKPGRLITDSLFKLQQANSNPKLP